MAVTRPHQWRDLSTTICPLSKLPAGHCSCGTPSSSDVCGQQTGRHKQSGRMFSVFGLNKAGGMPSSDTQRQLDRLPSRQLPARHLNKHGTR